MSFENFIEDIKEINTMPTIEKADGGYFYSEEDIGKLYRLGTKLIYITESAIDEMQLPLIEAIYRSIESAIAEDVKAAIDSSIAAELKTINSDINDIGEAVEVMENNLAKEPDAPIITNATIRKMVKDEMGAVSSNPLVNNSKRVKLSTLTMLKEEGYTTSEIAELRDADLI